MLTRNAGLIRRLNILLGLPSEDLDEVTPGAGWNTLLDRLHLAVSGEQKRVYKQDTFHLAATRDGVRAAQEGIRRQLYLLRHMEAGTSPPIRLDEHFFGDLAKSKSYLFLDEREGFFARYETTDFPTVAYRALLFLLGSLKLRPANFLTCAYEKCARVFVPLRKPHTKVEKHFCSQRCGNLVSAREWRKTKAEELKAKERERNKRRSVYFELHRMKKTKR